MNEQTSTWVTIGGGALMLIALFPGWSSISFAGVSESGDSPFDYFFTGGIAWLLVVAVGVLAVLRMTGKLGGAQNWSMIMALGAIVGALLMVIRILLGGRSELGIDLDRGPGMYIGFVAALVAAAGAVMGYLAGGGELADLKDMDKIKGAVDNDPDT